MKKSKKTINRIKKKTYKKSEYKKKTYKKGEYKKRVKRILRGGETKKNNGPRIAPKIIERFICKLFIAPTIMQVK